MRSSSGLAEAPVAVTASAHARAARRNILSFLLRPFGTGTRLSRWPTALTAGRMVTLITSHDESYWVGTMLHKRTARPVPRTCSTTPGLGSSLDAARQKPDHDPQVRHGERRQAGAAAWEG